MLRQEGFTFDAGPTVITAPPLLEELFTRVGKRWEDFVTLLPVHPFYELRWPQGDRFSYGSSLEAMLEQIRRHPRWAADEAGYLRFLRNSEEVFQAGYPLIDRAFPDIWSTLRVAPALLKHQAYRSVFSKVCDFVKAPELRQALSFHSLLIGGNPLSASCLYSMIPALERRWGVFFPKGGTGQLVSALVRLFTELGGSLLLQKTVTRIHTQGRQVTGVQTETGESWPADVVVSNADVVHTYASLLSESPGIESQKTALLKQKYGMSLFLIYFGTRTSYPEVAHHTILFGAQYERLLQQLFSPQQALPEDFSIYVHAPNRTDSGFAPPGGDSFYALCPVPHLGNLPIDWRKEAKPFAERLFSVIEKRLLPGLHKTMVTQKILTPLDFQNDSFQHLGAPFSLEPTLLQSASFRVKNRDPKWRGLYFVGAGTHPGAGIPGVVSSAKATERLILEDFPLFPSVRPDASLSPLSL